MNEYYFISHTGVKGRSGRYPWGSGDRPYQRLENSKGGIVGYIQRKKQAALEEKERAEAKKKEQMLADKEEVLRSGRAKDVSKYIGNLSTSELKAVCDRFQWENKLSEYSKKETKSNMEKIDKMMKGLKTINEWGDISIDTYNLMASAYNATDSGKRKPMTLIQKSSGGKKGGSTQK